jgi:hypothetical protein
MNKAWRNTHGGRYLFQLFLLQDTISQNSIPRFDRSMFIWCGGRVASSSVCGISRRAHGNGWLGSLEPRPRFSLTGRLYVDKAVHLGAV